MTSFPRFQPVADRALLVEFGERIDDAAHAEVLRLDAALAAAPVPGFVEAVPAYASVLIVFDPISTDHDLVETAVRSILSRAIAPVASATSREIEICYDAGFGPDLDTVADASGLTRDGVMEAHLSGDYRVYMYGFAPGYAYLGGVPGRIRLPRKPAAQRGVPAGSVIIAGSQCLVTTMEAPTGWWIIGRSPTLMLDPGAARPFLLDVGDTVRFKRVGPDAIPPSAGAAT